MTSPPQQAVDLQETIMSLPGVTECYTTPMQMDEIGEDVLSMPGEFGDLPQVAIMRTGGGQPNEIMIQVDIRFDKSSSAWLSLEFLAWWVRDWARSGHMIQMRPLALPPKAPHIQLGGTLRFVIEFFHIDERDDLAASLEVVGDMAESISENLEHYQDCFENPVEFVAEDDLTDLVEEEIDIESLIELAEEGDADAQFHLAFAYFEGESIDEDPKQAFHWFSQAAANGVSAAEFFVGRAFATGDGTNQDWDKALKHYQLAADAGLPLAMHAIGSMYDEGTGVKVDLSECIRWYQKGVDLDDPACKAELGDCYEHGRGVQRDLERALHLYEEALAQGFDPVEEARDRVRDQLQD